VEELRVHFQDFVHALAWNTVIHNLMIPPTHPPTHHSSNPSSSQTSTTTLAILQILQFKTHPEQHARCMQLAKSQQRFLQVLQSKNSLLSSPKKIEALKSSQNGDSKNPKGPI
jgi:hypothetical protein